MALSRSIMVHKIINKIILFQDEAAVHSVAAHAHSLLASGRAGVDS